MEEIKVAIKSFQEKKTLSDEECAKELGITLETLRDIQNDKHTLSQEELERINSVICDTRKKTSRRIIKILDLFFRLGTTIMALVVLLLCINGYEGYNTLIALLSIGVVCSSMTTLPRIEK